MACKGKIAKRTNKAVDYKSQTVDGPGNTEQSAATKKFFVKESKLFKLASALWHN